MTHLTPYYDENRVSGSINSFSAMYAGEMLVPFEEDRLGMTVTSGQVKITKDESNLIGISIGGGAPHCPCLYIIQVFDNTPTARDGTLEPGDELIAINGVSVKGASRTEAAQAIQESKVSVTINYNKLHVEKSKSTSFDIMIKKFKHRITNSISSSTADAFGLSRAILCNDTLVKRLKELEQSELMYMEIRERTRNTFKAFYDLNHVYREFGNVFTEISCYEKQPEAVGAFRMFGETHRLFEKYGHEMLNSVRSILGNLDTYIEKAIPDTKLTIKKYEDVKFEYLSYCLKVKELDDEEKDYYSMHEPLFRVETGNYEYRLVLRCRQEARREFSRLRADVTAKIELLDQKRVQHLSTQLLKLVSALHQYNGVCLRLFRECVQFPLYMELSQCFNFDYNTDEPTEGGPSKEEEEQEQEEQQQQQQEEVAKELLVEETLVEQAVDLLIDNGDE